MTQRTAVKAETGFSLKDQLFNAQTVAKLGLGLKKANPKFKRKPFEQAVLAGFPELSLKQRIDHMVQVLTKFLPKDFNSAQLTLRKALPAPLDPTLTDDDFGEFIWIVPGEYAAKHGCNKDNLDIALKFLVLTTQRFSAENAIRPFLQQFPRETLAFLTDCTQHDNYHVRRLASEGTRPLLPWAPRVNLPQKPVFKILDNLHDDPTRYVTRSVANALNDYSKSHPQAVVKQIAQWQKQQKQHSSELSWIKKHALRTLIKQAHPEALSLMGLTATPKFRLQQVQMSDRVKLGQALSISAQLTSLETQMLNIGIRIYFLKANGDHSSKLYKVKQVECDKNSTFALEKRIPLKPMTTRVLYPGKHFAAIEVNGVTRSKKVFDLTP